MIAGIQNVHMAEVMLVRVENILIPMSEAIPRAETTLKLVLFIQYKFSLI